MSTTSPIKIQLACAKPECGIVGPAAPADDAREAFRWLEMHTDLIHQCDLLQYRTRYIDMGTATPWSQT